MSRGLGDGGVLIFLESGTLFHLTWPLQTPQSSVSVAGASKKGRACQAFADSISNPGLVSTLRPPSLDGQTEAQQILLQPISQRCLTSQITQHLVCVCHRRPHRLPTGIRCARDSSRTQVSHLLRALPLSSYVATTGHPGTSLAFVSSLDNVDIMPPEVHSIAPGMK